MYITEYLYPLAMQFLLAIPFQQQIPCMLGEFPLGKGGSALLHELHQVVAPCMSSIRPLPGEAPAAI